MPRDHDEAREAVEDGLWRTQLVMAAMAFVTQKEPEPFEGSDALPGVEIPLAHSVMRVSFATFPRSG